MTDDDIDLPPDPERFVMLWMKSATAIDVAMKMRRTLVEVLAWAETLRAEGVQLPPRPVRHTAMSRPNE